MRLLVVSHKEIWRSLDSPSGFSTVGGFPFQIEALTELFDQTTLVCCVRPGPAPVGARPLWGRALVMRAVPEPPGSDLSRKVALLPWLAWNIPRLWREVRSADAVHALVPGDIGTIGLVLARAQRKLLFARHCGTWRYSDTIAARLTNRLLIRWAGGRTVVMATGGGEVAPEAGKPEIGWIFSTTLRQREVESIPVAPAWQAGFPLRLITVGRLTADKNTAACVRALPEIRAVVSATQLIVVGDGPERERLESLAQDMGVGGAVQFRGNLSHEEVLGALSEAHLFLFPTRVAEGFPKAVLEAMAAGLPVVVSRVSVLPHLVERGCGVLLAGTTSRDITESVVRLVQSPEVMAQMGRRGRAAAREFTLERWGDEIRERLERAWGRPLRDGGSPPAARTGGG